MLPAFLDTSALAKLYHSELGTESIERLFERAPFALISRLGAVEMDSVLSGKVRAGALDEAGASVARRRFRADVRSRRIQVVTLRNRHYERASRLIEKYSNHIGLRTLDSLQLAIAADLSEAGQIDVFVTADKVLVRVGELENL